MTRLASRERILRTLEFKDAGYLPCCFMSFTVFGIRAQHPNLFRYLETGLEKPVGQFQIRIDWHGRSPIRGK